MTITRLIHKCVLITAFTLLVSFLTGCATPQSEPPTPLPPTAVDSNRDMTEQIALADQFSEEQFTVDPSYVAPQTIRPGSLLNIRVYVAGDREVDIRETRVDDDGRVRLPLVGSVSIAGAALSTATQILEESYANYYVSPQVSMSIVRDDDSDSFPWGFVTVLGRVNRQGRVAIPPTRDLTVSSAIQKAGGFNTSARVRSIRVTRPMPNGESQTFDVNMRNIGREGRTEEDIVLQPNDVVFIPERLF